MDFKNKVINALFQFLEPEYVRLEDEDGITGFVVTRQFEGMSSLDRQRRIEEALRQAALSVKDQRRVLMIAGLTPEEYESVGARIRVQQIKKTAKDGIELLLQGGRTDAEYVRKALTTQEGIQTTSPKPVQGPLGVLMSFTAKGTLARPLTKERAIRILKRDSYIDVTPIA